jgi:hypothetical protein
MKIKIIVEKTKTGFSAYAEKQNIFSVGGTIQELKYNMLEAVNLFYSKDEKDIGEKDLYFKLDLPQFFEFYKVLNAKAISERIGMHQSLLAQYISGIKKPSAIQLSRIQNGIREIGQELVNVSLLIK